MKHIPNILSSLRIVLIPVFVWRISIGDTLGAAWILLFSGLSDMLDGLLARAFGWITPLGKVLDPVADKLTQVTVCLVLLTRARLERFVGFFIILLIKELVMLTLGGYLIKKGVKLDGSKWFGKILTVIFYISMVSLVFFPEMPDSIIFVMLSITTGCAILAALLYIPDFLHYKRSVNKEEK